MKSVSYLFVFLFSFLFVSQVHSECLTTLEELDQLRIPTSWIETTMDDGKPMTISVLQDAEGLRYIAEKEEKKWLEGDICFSPDGRKFTIENSVPTEEVPAIAREFISRTQIAEIHQDRVTFTGGTWSGDFKAAD